MRESMMSLFIVGENIVWIGDKMVNLQTQVDKTMELTSQSQLLLKDSSQLIQKEIISINQISRSVVEMGNSMTRLNTKSEEMGISYSGCFNGSCVFNETRYKDVNKCFSYYFYTSITIL